MFIKDRTFRLINIIYIILTILLGLVLIYLIINTMVSLKYEQENEMLDFYFQSNLPSIYIQQLLENLYAFLAYLFINVIYLSIMGFIRIKKTEQR